MIDKLTALQIYMYHDDEDPKGLYAERVNIVDFAQKVEAYVNALRDSGTPADSPPATPPQ